MSTASTVQSFADVETSSDNYAARFSGHIGEWMLTRQSEALRSLLRGSRPGPALDVGGGHGQLIQPLHALGYQLTVLASSDQCRPRVDSSIQRGLCSFSVGPPTALPFDDRAFSLTTCVRLVSHCDDWPQLIAELCRTSREEVVIDYPPIASFNLLTPILFRVKKLIEGNTRSFAIFTHAQIDREFLRHGFRRAERAGEFFWPMGIHRLLGNVRLSSALENAAARIGLRNAFGSPVLARYVRD